VTPGVDTVLRCYPQIYFACHKRHVRDQATQTVISAHQASILDHLDDLDALELGRDPNVMVLGYLKEHEQIDPQLQAQVSGKLDKGYKLGFQASSDHVSTHLSFANVLVSGEPTREKILEAASNLVAEPGIRGVTIKGVAREAAVSRVTVYDHFQSKAGLLEALAKSSRWRKAPGQIVPHNRKQPRQLAMCCIDVLYGVPE
jgi:hypothetical protein